MANLIPTPIVDKNGVASLRHKKALSQAPGAASLAGTRPSIGTAPSREVVHEIKGKALHQDSSVSDFLDKPLQRGGKYSDKPPAQHPSLGKAVAVPDDVVYDFLRLGLDANEAAAFTSLGLSPDDVENDKRFTNPFRNNLHALSKSSTRYRLNREEVIERLQESGVSGLVASKVLSNGLQDGHLNRALDDEQVVELFSKWKFRGIHEQYRQGGVVSDDVIESMLDGKIPFEARVHKIADLEKIVREIDRNEDAPAYEGIRDDHDYFVSIVNKAASEGMSDSNNPLGDVHKLVQAFGPEVLDLKYPMMASIDVSEEWAKPGMRPVTYKAGIEGAKYLEKAHAIAQERTDRWSYMSMKMSDSSGGLRVDRKYLRNWELMQLREIGVTPEKAYEYLIDRELTLTQIRGMQQDNIPVTLADGIL